MSVKDHSRLRPHQFGKKVFLRMFLGYVWYASGIWKGDMMVIVREKDFGKDTFW